MNLQRSLYYTNRTVSLVNNEVDPLLQEKVYTEITSVIGPDDDVTSEDLKHFPYMEQVLKETLRFFTIVPFLSRRSTEEYKLGKFHY